jgi:hypothetical protein
VRCRLFLAAGSAGVAAGTVGVGLITADVFLQQVFFGNMLFLEIEIFELFSVAEKKNKLIYFGN